MVSLILSLISTLFFSLFFFYFNIFTQNLECFSFFKIYFNFCRIYLTYGNFYYNICHRGDDMGRNISIKVARAQLDITQKQLAEKVGISRQTMNAIEQGEYNPTIKLCRAICKILGKSLDELFGEDDSNEATKK